MATSQFTIYTASDANGPGYMTGLSGSLVSILNACLVNGYGTKPGAGWTKPLADSGSVYACYKQGAGSQRTLFINDNAPNASAGTREAWAVGWETITSVFSGSAVANNGTGANQFPLSSQQGSGHVVWRKSTTADNTIRYWILAADSSSFYLWVQPGDSGTTYNHYSFGDCFSLLGSADYWKCYIIGRAVENNGTSNAIDWADQLPMTQGTSGFPNVNYQYSAQPGHYIDRTAFGNGVSLPFTKRGDSGVSPNVLNAGTAPTTVIIAGVLPCPNGPDNSLYLCPLWILEPGSLSLRGRFRGLYQVCHPISSFSDGQLITGAYNYAGKTFMIVRPSYNSSFWALEISNTVETN